MTLSCLTFFAVATAQSPFFFSGPGDWGSNFFKTLLESEEINLLLHVDCKPDVASWCSQDQTLKCLDENKTNLSTNCAKHVEKLMPSVCSAEIEQLKCNGLDVPKLTCLVTSKDSLSPRCKEAVDMSEDYFKTKTAIKQEADMHPNKWSCPAKFAISAFDQCCAFGGMALNKVCCDKNGGWCDPDAFALCASEMCNNSGGEWLKDGLSAEISIGQKPKPMCCPPRSGWFSFASVPHITIGIFFILVIYVLASTQIDLQLPHMDQMNSLVSKAKKAGNQFKQNFGSKRLSGFPPSSIGAPGAAMEQPQLLSVPQLEPYGTMPCTDERAHLLGK